jgi:large subunit ribosomal protein L19
MVQEVIITIHTFMTYQILLNSKVVKDQIRTDIPEFKVGTVVDVHYKISEGDKERIQLFSGIVIDRHGGNSLDATFTVLKNATAGIKVTRTFPLHSPHIEKVILVSKLQRTKQASLYHLHDIKDPIKSSRAKHVISSEQKALNKKNKEGAAIDTTVKPKTIKKTVTKKVKTSK